MKNILSCFSCPFAAELYMAVESLSVIEYTVYRIQFIPTQQHQHRSQSRATVLFIQAYDRYVKAHEKLSADYL